MKKMVCIILSLVLAFSLASVAFAAPAEDGDVVIYLTRHGKTMFNATGQMQGWSDTPLLQEGIDLASALGAGLKDSGVEFDAVYASDLNRQRMTAKYAMEQLGIPYESLKEIVGLREVCYGSAEGQPGDPIYEVLVEENNLNAVYEVFVVLGFGAILDYLAEIDTLGMAETLDQASARILGALDDIVADAQANGYHTVMAVTSGMITNILVEALGAEMNGELANCSVTKIIYHDGEFTVDTLGDTSYLEKGQEILGMTAE